MKLLEVPAMTVNGNEIENLVKDQITELDEQISQHTKLLE